LPEIIEAYVTVFGEEYRSIITARLLDCTYVFYNTYEGMKSYLDYHNRDYPQYIFDEAQRREKIMGIKLNELYIELMNLFPLETLPYLDSAGSIDAARKSFFEDFPNNVSDEVALVISDLKVMHNLFNINLWFGFNVGYIDSCFTIVGVPTKFLTNNASIIAIIIQYTHSKIFFTFGFNFFAFLIF